MQAINFPIVPQEKGEKVINLQNALQLFLKQKIFKTLRAPNKPTAEDLARLAERMQREMSAGIYGKASMELVHIFQVQQRLGDGLRGRVEEKTASRMNETLRKLGALDDTGGDKKYVVSGMVLKSNGVALAGYNTEAFVITLRQDISVGKAVTDRNGGYSISFVNPLKIVPDIEVRAFKTGDEGNVSRSALRYNASPVETVDVIVDAKKEKETFEFDRILSDVRLHLGNTRPGDLKEDAENRNITYIANKTGWDSRVTAMLASAHQLGETLKIDPAHVYALLRAGVPATEDAIKSISLENAKNSIENAIQKNVIPGTGNTTQTLKTLENLSVTHLISSRPFDSVSSMGELLDLRLNANQKTVFAQTQKQVGDDNAKLWSALAEKGFTADMISQLQLDGKLAYLTGRNAPLMKKVFEKFSLKNDVELVSSGLYKSSEWKTLMGGDIPEGLTADEYAGHLSRQVKLSYPSAVAGEMIKGGEIDLGSDAPKQELANFFYANDSKSNHIGVKQVKTWEGFEQLSDAAKSSAKTMERLYQITPSDESMIALSKAGISSAWQTATQYTKKEFLKKMGPEMPSLEEAEQIYNKSSEVYSGALGIATTYLTSQSMPNVYSISGKNSKEPNEIVASPTLEELLGNMDYCDCEHCKSVLSPAAYLVELLQFIDLEGVPHAKSNPVEVLTGRRPDIQHIQLSCENTNVALPYIDLVNEILEYYIVNGNLNDLKGHDVPEGTDSTDLLAEPKFVNATAYDELKTKVYPYNLPFHQPLETLRRLLRMWDVTLENMLAIFATPLASRKEALNCNEDEYKTLTDVAFKNLPEYFGEPENNTLNQLNAAISDGKTFCRRVGISYEDLVALLKTNFINPGFELVPLFQALHISLADLARFYAGAISDAELDAMLPLEIDPADYGGDIKQWLRDQEQLIMGLITLTDIGPEIVECDFSQVELRFALPDNAANSLTAVAYHRFHRFLRLMHKTGWSITTLDEVIQALLPQPSNEITDANLDAVFVQLFDRIANFKKIAGLLSYAEKKYADLLLVLDPANDAELRKVECAKILKLSLPELSELIAFTGADPLANDMEADESSFLKLIIIAQQLKAASLKVADLAYILQHNDITGKLAPSDESLLSSVKILKDTLNAVEKENSASPDNADFNFAKGKMLLLYDAATTDIFFELLLDTKTFSAPLITSEEGLPDKLTAASSNLGFDPFKKEITFAGLLSNATKTDLENAADSLVLADMDAIATQPELDTFIANFKSAVEQLFTEAEAELTEFATNFPELKVIYDAVIAETTPEAQTQKLVELILPELKARLKINGLQQALISILKTDPDTVSVLTSKKEVVRSETDANEPVLFDFTELEQNMIFDQNQTYNFYIDAPVTDNYVVYLSAPQNTIVSLKIGVDEVIPVNTIDAEEEVNNAAPLSLTTGKLYLAELNISALPAGESVAVSWRTKGMEKSSVPASALYGANQVSMAKTSLIRLLKAAQLTGLFKFTPQELAYFASENTETQGFLNAVDTDGSINVADLNALWNIVGLLVSFKLLKKENEPEKNTWLQVLKNPSVKNSQNKLLLEYFNLWQEADLAAILGHFAVTRADLSKLSVLKKVTHAIAAINSIYYPAADLLTWVTNDPGYQLVADIKTTVKQKVTEAAWLESMQTVSDPVRNLLRDALVDYILQYSKPSPEITDANKLYEYFLIDVEMDACMKTSRIRQALSTVQLFIQRCLMNLEPDVDPESIRADRWAWMKRYRVWEANRKVFLYPENWLEPELRDNKSYLFKELEGELLQSEITDESAELAFLNYLKKLDDIAKLDMVGMYLEENAKNNPDDDILHVFGRTNGNTRQYYYRKFEKGYWTPWEKVSLNVEGDHVFPVIWRKRLFLFWLSIFEKPVESTRSQTPQTMGDQPWGQNAKKNVEVTMCWGEYYKGKWTSPKSTELKNPMVIKGLNDFYSNKLHVYGRKESVENPPGKFRERLVFWLNYAGLGGWQKDAVFTFTTKNAPPYLESNEEDAKLKKVSDNLYTMFRSPYSHTPDQAGLNHTQFWMPGRVFKVDVKQPFWAEDTKIREKVLEKKNKLTRSFSILTTWHPVRNQFEAPFSYADEHSTFFVQPDERTFTPVKIFDGYYPLYETPVKYTDIPKLVDKPIPGWPPEEEFSFGEEVIVSNPWEWSDEAIRTNDNYSKMLPTTDTFTYGETVFDTGGKQVNFNQNTF